MLWQLDPGRKIFYLSVHAARQVGCLGDTRKGNAIGKAYPYTRTTDGGSDGLSGAGSQQRWQKAVCYRLAATRRTRALRLKVQTVRALYVRNIGLRSELLKRRTECS